MEEMRVVNQISILTGTDEFGLERGKMSEVYFVCTGELN